MSLDENVSSN